MVNFLCLDLGSSGAKAAILDESGKIFSIGFKEYRFTKPKHSWSEINPNLVWGRMCEAIREVLIKSSVEPKRIVGVSISSIGVYKDLTDAVEKTVRIASQYEPNTRERRCALVNYFRIM